MFEALRALALELNVWAHGVPATVTLPSGDPVSAQVLWMTLATDDMPVGLSVQRREPRRVAVLRRADVPAVPRGTLIVAPERVGDPLKAWRVDGTDRIEVDQTRVLVVCDAAATALLNSGGDAGDGGANGDDEGDGDETPADP